MCVCVCVCVCVCIHGEVSRGTRASQVLKDATKLSEHKGVLDGGSVVHVVGRPDDAGRSSAPASADASRGTGRDSQAARNQALPVPGAGQTVMIGGVSVPLGGDGLPPQNGGDGPILNQFLQQALGSMVFGVGPGAGRAVEPTGARPRNTESAAELNHRRFSDMNAFADFGEAYLGTVSEAASNFRMRADEQQRVLQELQRRRTQELQQGQGGYRAAGANAAFTHSAANSDADRRLASAMQGSADELRAELGSQEMPRLSTAASGAQANVSSHDENSAVLAEESVPVNETIDTLQRGLEQSEAAAPEAGTVSPSDAGDAGVSERVGGGFGSAATPATEARTSTGATALALSAVGADAPSGAALVDRVSPDIETIVISSDEDVPELAPPESSPEARHGTGAAEAAEAGAGPPPQSADTDRSANELHDLVTCDGCGLSPIRGPRWKCSTCQDFDLCGVCHTQFCATGQHHIEGHAFTRVPPTPHRRINRPPIIQGTLRRNYTSTTSATAALAPDLSRLIQAILRNYDAMRPFLRELQTSLSDERDLTGLARDRTEGLAVNLAPAVRDLSALMSDLSPLLSNLQMGDQAGHAHIEMQDMRVHTPTGYRSLEAQRREQYLRRQQYLQYRQQQQQQQVSQRSQRQQQRGAEVLRRRGRSRADVGQNSLTPGGGRTGIEGNAGNRRPSSSAAARAGAGAGSAAPAASMAPRAAGPAARAVRDQIFTEGEDTSRQLDDGVIVEDVDEGDESDNDEESMPDLAVSSGSSSDQSWVPDLEELPQPAASDVGTRTSTATAFSAAGTSNASRSDVAFSYPATNPSGLAATGASPPPGQPLVIGGGMQDQPWQEAPERSGMAQLRNLRQRLESGEFLDDDPSEDEVRQVGQLDPATLQRIRQGDPAAMQQIQQMLGGGAFAGVGGPFGMGGTFSAGNMQVQMHVLAVDQNGRPVPLPFLQQPQQQQQRQENQHQGFQGAFNPFAPPTQSSQNSTQPPNVQRPMDQTHQHPIAATVSASAVQHGLTSNLHSQLQGQSPSHMHSQGSMEPSSSSTQSQALPTVHAEPRGGASLDSTVGGDNGQATTAPPLAAAAVFQQLMQQIVSQTGGPPGASEQPSEPPRPPPPNPPPPPPPGSSLPVHNIPNTPAGAVPDQPGMTPVFPYVLSGGSMVQHVPGMNGGMMMMIPPGWEGRDGPSNFPNPPFDNGGGVRGSLDSSKDCCWRWLTTFLAAQPLEFRVCFPYCAAIWFAVWTVNVFSEPCLNICKMTS